MQTKIIILLGLGIVAAGFIRGTHRRKPAWAQHMKGWQWFFGMIGVVLTVLIIFNPELVALGLLGDSAFFDMLVLALGLQMHMFAVQTCRRCVTVLAKGGRWLRIPSPGLSYLLAISMVVIESAVSTFQKIVHRICS